jgi:hypothetical protein
VVRNGGEGLTVALCPCAGRNDRVTGVEHVRIAGTGSKGMRMTAGLSLLSL